MSGGEGKSKGQGERRVFQPPRGTRDFYPVEMARRRWIEERWRRTAVRHGFEEIDGPTFEHLDLYTVKSGEGIVSELFSFTRAGGETALALRPEFTPTLARMVAARANALPKPIKWFSVGPYFRAERPQRGRLREFLQWNVDVLGESGPEADAEAIACCVGFLESVGLKPGDVTIKCSNRTLVAGLLAGAGVAEEKCDGALALLDRRGKLPAEVFAEQAGAVGLNVEAFDRLAAEVSGLLRGGGQEIPTPLRGKYPSEAHDALSRLWRDTADSGMSEWLTLDLSTVRGLAYYTGTVFEVHEASGAERAIAGGGRYDNLVELFGGPATPAVGFAMGDVVLALVLQDKGLMPGDAEIARELGLAPDVFVVAANDEADASALRPMLAALRRCGMHARRSYKSTRNVGKLLQDADRSGARFAVILESATKAQVKDLHSKEQREIVGTDAGDVAAKIDAVVRPG